VNILLQNAFQRKKVVVIGATSGASSSRWNNLSDASTKAPNQALEKH